LFCFRQPTFQTIDQQAGKRPCWPAYGPRGSGGVRQDVSLALARSVGPSTQQSTGIKDVPLIRRFAEAFARSFVGRSGNPCGGVDHAFLCSQSMRGLARKRSQLDADLPWLEKPL
jgi:hypothetical protein